MFISLNAILYVVNLYVYGAHLQTLLTFIDKYYIMLLACVFVVSLACQKCRLLHVRAPFIFMHFKSLLNCETKKAIPYCKLSYVVSMYPSPPHTIYPPHIRSTILGESVIIPVYCHYQYYCMLGENTSGMN